MNEYYVEWTIQIIANSPEEAARQALEIQRDAASRATAFKVVGSDGESHDIDLTKIEEDNQGAALGAAQK